MALGDGLRARMVELERKFPDTAGRIAGIAEAATLRAVERATELTPPNTFGDGELRGVNMISGEMAEHWATDSTTVPSSAADGFSTTLANDKEYASYVNDGHWVVKEDGKPRFVPGLYIDDDGLLSYDLEKRDKRGKKVGLLVGTKTTYVEGLHITDQAIDVYDETARAELEKLLREVRG